MTSPATLVALAGDLGVNTPCHLFAGYVRTSIKIEGKNRKIRLRPPLDRITIKSFDGGWGVVHVEERQGPIATLRLHRIHLDQLGLDTTIVLNKEVLPPGKGSGNTPLLVGAALLISLTLTIFLNKRHKK